MSAIKLQINSKEALERLIGGDSELEVELRNSIVHDFSQRYLKKLVSDQFDKLASLAWQEVEKFAKEKFGTVQYSTWGRNYIIDLKPEIKTAVTNILQEESKKLINEAVAEYFNHLNLEALVKTVVDRQITIKIGDEVKRQVNAKINEIMKSVGV